MIEECRELARRASEMSGAPEEIMEIADVALYGVMSDPESVARSLRSFLDAGERPPTNSFAATPTAAGTRITTTAQSSAATRSAYSVVVDPRTGASTVVVAEDASEAEREAALAEIGRMATADARPTDSRRAREAARVREWRERQRAEADAEARGEAERRAREAERVRRWRASRNPETAGDAADQPSARPDWLDILRRNIDEQVEGAARTPEAPIISFDSSGSMSGVDVAEILRETSLSPATASGEEYGVPTSSGFGRSVHRESTRLGTRATSQSMADAARAAAEAGEAASRASEATAELAREMAGFIGVVAERESATREAAARPTAGDMLRGIADAARERGEAYSRLSALGSQVNIGDADVGRAEVALSSAIQGTDDLEPLVEMADVITAAAAWVNPSDREFMESVTNYHRNHARGMTPNQEIHFRRILRKRKHVRAVIDFLAGRSVGGAVENPASIVEALPEPGAPDFPTLRAIGRDIGRMEWPGQVEDRIADAARAGDPAVLAEMLRAALRQGFQGSGRPENRGEAEAALLRLEGALQLPPDEADIARAAAIVSRQPFLRALAEVAAGIRRPRGGR